MRRGASTVVCVVGDHADVVRRTARGLGDAANVVHVSGVPDNPSSPADVGAFDREVRAIYAKASAAQSPYAVCEADPLGAVREAWRRRFDRGEDVLEEFAGTVRPDVELPDYYLLVHPPEPDLGLEWYAGFLRELRPARVVLVTSDADPATVTGRASRALASLRAGPWWPPVREVVDAARVFVPRVAPP
jgi:hypothetical protein